MALMLNAAIPALCSPSIGLAHASWTVRTPIMMNANDLEAAAEAPSIDTMKGVVVPTGSEPVSEAPAAPTLPAVWNPNKLDVSFLDSLPKELELVKQQFDADY